MGITDICAVLVSLCSALHSSALPQYKPKPEQFLLHERAVPAMGRRDQ